VLLGNPSTPKSSEDGEWAITVANWLRTNVGESKATQFSDVKGIDEQKKYLLSLVSELIQPKPQ
jgi:ATP-dependent Zn protease